MIWVVPVAHDFPKKNC